MHTPSHAIPGWDHYRTTLENDSINIHDTDSIARVSMVLRDRCRVITPEGEKDAFVTGRLLMEDDGPATGDWVLSQQTGDENMLLIHDVLPRYSYLSRKVPGKGVREQVMAANIDIAFITQSLDETCNVRTIERYLVTVRSRGIEAAVILTKRDLNQSWQEKTEEIARLVSPVPVFSVSGATGEGVDEAARRIETGLTACLLGPSGVGKSTLLNSIMGEDRQRTGSVRAGDSKGRHVTTARHLFLLPGGGLIMDTPGMRELQLWEEKGSVDDAFPDIASLAQQCRFRDCTHEGEPGCAVNDACNRGDLDPKRLANYQKMRREIEFFESRFDFSLEQKKKKKEKRLSKDIKDLYRTRKKR